MPGLDRSIVEHRLPIKSGFRPHQQPAWRCNPNILPDIYSAMSVCRMDFQCCSRLQEEWETSCLH